MEKQNVIILVLVAMLQPNLLRSQEEATKLQKGYMDESHCLTSPEIRSDKDNSISCYCRDAIVEARYVNFTYVISGKDSDLSGPFLSLQHYAMDQCSRDSAEAGDMGFIGKMQDATTLKDWKWSGPEVVRTYPPDDVIRQIKPDSHGMISVEYTVVLLQRNSQGRVEKTESFSSLDRIPANLLRRDSPLQTAPPPKAPSKN